MKPDYLFVAAGAVTLGVSAVLVLSILRRRHKEAWLPALLWGCLSAGLLVQGYAPHLEIRGKFLVVPAPLGASSTFDARPIVERERGMELLSALLTGGAAVGLAWWHRSALTKPGIPREV